MLFLKRASDEFDAAHQRGDRRAARAGAPQQDAERFGAAYGYLIGEFADSAGKKGGEFYTPRSVVRMMVNLVEPKQGTARSPTAAPGRRPS